MKIKQHRLENIYSHKSTTVDLGVGLIGITGGIGAGKSTLISSIGSNITGEWRNGRGGIVKKERLVTIGEKHGRATTIIEIRPGLEVTVERDIKKGRASLSYSDGRPPIEGADAVSAILLQELETDRSVLSEVVFVAQGQIEELLFASDSTKDRLAAKFFGIDRSVAIEKDLSARINAIILVTLAESSAQLEEKRRDARTRLQKWQSELEEVGESKDEEIATLQGHLAAYLAADQQRGARQTYTSTKARLEDDIKTLIESTDMLAASIDAIPIEAVRKKHVAEAEKNRNWNRREDLKATIAQLQRQAQSRPPIPHDKNRVEEQLTEIERIKQKVSVSSSTLALRKAMLTRLSNGGVATCETCGEHPADEAKMAAMVAQAMDVQADKDRLSGLQLAFTRAAAANQEWEQKEHTARTRLDEAEAELATLADEGPGDPDKWERNIASYDNMRDTLAREQKELQKRRNLLAELVEPAGEAPAYPDGFEANVAQARIIELQAHKANLAGIDREIRLCEREIQFVDEHIASALKVEEENLIQAQLKAALVRIRARFHPDGAPKELIGQRIERMEGSINDLLKLFGSRFLIRAVQGGGFNFEALFPNKPGVIAASELSGGEKVELSICFRIAAVQTFSASVGMLVLDEPTNNLSDEAVEHFKKVLSRLSEMAKQLSMTFVVITHSATLDESFDRVIHLTQS